jgi:hypothetical protein
MRFNAGKARDVLARFDFEHLFVEELGWDRHGADLSVPIAGTTFSLRAVAEKRGMVVWVCQAPAGLQIPNRAIRRKIETQVAKTTLEHLIIFTDAKRAEQVWCWARREVGKPTVMREHFWYVTSGNRGFLQKLEAIVVLLAEEETLTLPDVTARARAAFDVERVTKRFYDQFKVEHKAFLDFISGIAELADKEWYASLMLNRLMFIYFMQRKGFLNAEPNYLRGRLSWCQKEKGQDKFYSFYRYFLLRLFHEGLGGKARNRELDKLLGRIPYLNGGLFEMHPIEERCPKIAIPDEAFTRIFAFFDRYQWHLDERPLRNDNEINPDVLGYIFEKYVNQKQMGAYYTKEDITEYISKNTVIPFLFDSTKAKCKVAFENPGGPTIWDHLRDDPDRYIYTAVRHGTEHALPREIAAGIEDVSARTQWNRKAHPDFALPTEIWREVVARRTRYAEVRAKLAAGEVRDINDLITLNLDIRQFAQDVIERCEGPELLRAFWKSIEGVTILDPTCGSGAFLFAALNILEPLYATCLDRMEAFIADLNRADPRHDPKKVKDFKATLSKVTAHPNARYFTLKSIILNNLFGVDIMEEAVEICKLRLFLKLAAQVDPDQTHDNLGIEPLPDIDFNIRAGNTLVGYATYEEVTCAITSAFDFENAGEKIAVRAGDIQQAFDSFRRLQTDGDGSVPTQDKIKLRKRLGELNNELNTYLSRDYGTKSGDAIAHAKWVRTRAPFHWLIQFYGILNGGGFDVIIGNPPYLDLRQLSSYSPRGFSTSSTKNLYSLVLERCDKLSKARQFYIVPISSVATEGYIDLQRILLKREIWFSSFDDRPAHLFDGLDKNTLSILILSKQIAKPSVISSRLNRWTAEERSVLFSTLQFYRSTNTNVAGCLPRIGSSINWVIWDKLFARRETLASALSANGKWITYYSRKVNSFLQILNFVPEVRDGNGNLRPPSEFKEMRFCISSHAAAVFCVLNSGLFRWFMDTVSDGSHLNRRETNQFPFDPNHAAGLLDEFAVLAERLSRDLKANSFNRAMTYKHDTLTVQCIVPRFSKQIIDEIDKVLARHYGLNDYELDYIVHYDIKYRVGREDGSE